MGDRTKNPSLPLEARAGGYHSEGVPGEEAEARKRMRVVTIDNVQRTINQSQPVKGGMTAESTSEHRQDTAERQEAKSAGARGLYILARKEADTIESPVLHAGAADQAEAVAVFTRPESASKYITAAGWDDTHEAVQLTPADVGTYLRAAKVENVAFAVIDPIREQHLAGEPQQVLSLDDKADLSGEELFRAVQEQRAS